MTREIKFRAWDGEKMINDSEAFARMLYIGFGGTVRVVTGHTDWEKKEHFHGVSLIENITLMQFTGLKDKNGKEIYEGDVVKGNIVAPQLLLGQTRENSSTRMGGVVEYDYDGFILKAIQGMCDPERDRNANWFPFFGDAYDGDFEDMEIIGNIYENPELQEGVNDK